MPRATRAHQATQLRAVRRMHPANWQFGNECIDATGLHLGDVGQPPLSQRLIVGDGARIEQNEPFYTLKLPPNDLERKIAAERKADQGEPPGCMHEKLFGHAAQRRQITKREHTAVVLASKSVHLMRE